MSIKGSRNTNGEGSTYFTVQKIKRKSFSENGECSVCRTCTDRSACNNRIGWDKCKKCKECKEECLVYCDRFYCRAIWQSQITKNGKQITVANTAKKKDAVQKKKAAERSTLSKPYQNINKVSIYDFIYKVDREKYINKEICANTVATNKNKHDKIKKSFINELPIQKVTSEMINDFLNEYSYLSQSELDKLQGKLKIGFDEAVRQGYILPENNPMEKAFNAISDKDTKMVQAFDIEEEKRLLEYIFTHRIVKNFKCNYEENTIRNIIVIALLSLMRIGEIGALNFIDHVSFEKKHFLVSRTLTRDENENIIMGETTKTGRRKRKKGRPDFRYIPFSIFDEDIVISALRNQYNIAKNTLNNNENLLFCKKNGKYISHTNITTMFKRICREANVKMNLADGCSIHMTRHTGITRLIEFGLPLMVIASISGHSSTTQIEETYGHILDSYRNEILKDSNFKYTKADVIPKELKKLILDFYKQSK